MYKKTIVLFCVFLTILVALAACKKHSRYGEIVVDQQGMEHIIMTDANGVTVIDSDGNLVEIMTDSRDKKPIAVPTENGTQAPGQIGTYETHAVTFPGIVENGETVEDAICFLTVPEGWKQVGNNMLILEHEQTGARVALDTDIGGTVTGAIEKLDEDLEKLPVKGEPVRTEVRVDGLLATRTQYEMNNMTLTSYLLLTENRKVCRIACTVETDKYDAANADALVQLIRFK